MKRCILLSVPLLSVSAVSALTVSVDKVQQRYPWNGLVDIDYTVSYAEGDPAPDALADRLVFSYVNAGVTPAVTGLAVSVNGYLPMPLAAGSHRVSWNSAVGGVTFKSDAFRILAAVRHYAPRYLVIDVSEGPTAEAFPVTYRSAPPNTEAGFNCDEYKTGKIVLREIPPGTFLMGSPPDELSHTAHEDQRVVVLTKPFYMGLFEVTQMQYSNVWSGAGVSSYKGPLLPADSMSYNALRGSVEGNKWPMTNAVDAASFFGVLRAKTGLDFDLPTEAQWEYACRAGTTTAFNTGVYANSQTDMNAQYKIVGRFNENDMDGKGGPEYNGGPTVVGCYQPNTWGLYDMHGNVREQCLDWKMPDGACPTNQIVDPVGCADKSQNINKGGQCNQGYMLGRAAAAMTGDWPSEGRAEKGFRLSLTVKGL